MKNVTIFDRVALTSRKLLADGSLVAPATLARTGVQAYYAYELGLTAADGFPDRFATVRLYRPAEEVFDAQSLASFESVPLTDDHPKNFVTPQTRAELERGVVHTIGRDGDLMTGIVHARKEIVNKIQDGKQELSNGYSFALDLTPGKTPTGEAYDGVQRNIRGNHVALVDSARCGSACRVADSNPVQPKGVTTMSDNRTIVVDGIPMQVSDQATAAIDKVTKERDEARTQAKTAADKLGAIKVGDKSYTLDELVKLANDQATQVATLKKDVMTPEQRDAAIADWSAMQDTGKRLAPNVALDGKTCHAYRKEVVGHIVANDEKAKATVSAILGTNTLDAADEDTVKTVFNVLATTTASVDAGDSANGANVAAVLVGDSRANSNAPAYVGRAAFLAGAQPNEGA